MRKHITLWRLAFVAALVSILGKLTLTDWGSWAAIIAAIVAVGLVVVGGIKWIIRQARMRHLFEVY